MKKFNQGRERSFNDRGSNRSSSSFNRNSSRGSDRGSFGSRDRGSSSMMHSAVCFECGKNCEVPFKPTGGKPVFCSNCFENKSKFDRPSDFSSNNRSNKGNSFDANSFDGKNKFNNNDKKLDEIVSRLDRIIKLLTPVIDLRDDSFSIASKESKKNVDTKNSSKKITKPTKITKTKKIKK